MPALFSNDMEYEKPEQPPPTTPTRRPEGSGFCCAMISFTFLMALGVRLMGGAFFCGVLSTLGVLVVVDIALFSPQISSQIIAERLSTAIDWMTSRASLTHAVSGL